MVIKNPARKRKSTVVVKDLAKTPNPRRKRKIVEPVANRRERGHKLSLEESKRLLLQLRELTRRVEYLEAIPAYVVRALYQFEAAELARIDKVIVPHLVARLRTDGFRLDRNTAKSAFDEAGRTMNKSAAWVESVYYPKKKTPKK